MAEKNKKLALGVITQMIVLSTNAFGLVAALAWNNVIQEIVETYIKPYVGKDSGLISLLIYAILITALAVGVTYQLSKLKEKLS